MSVNNKNSALKTISQTSKIVKVQDHVLRFWEEKFDKLDPKKIHGRRYYSQADIEMIEQIKILLHEQGFTIKGAQKHLGVNKISKTNTDLFGNSVDEKVKPQIKSNPEETENNKELLKNTHQKLLSIKDKLKVIRNIIDS